MKNSTSYACIILVAALSLLGSCREPLISSEDEKMEALIQGEWILQNSVPQFNRQIFMSFSPDFSVNIILFLPDGPYDLNAIYRIEDSDLHFLIVDSLQSFESVYHIKELTPFDLVLFFVDNGGIKTTQTYVRP